MTKKAPSLGAILVMAGFTLAVIALLLLMWIDFGGRIPFKAHAYRFKLNLPEAPQLVSGADVRISGVDVGRVTSVAVKGNVTQAVVEMDTQFAPIPSNTQAIMRQKTAVGEAFIDITPGTPDAPTVPENGTLPVSQVTNAVQFDEFLKIFDKSTQDAFKAWLVQQGRALAKTGGYLNDSIAFMAPFFTDADQLMAILHEQSAGIREVIDNGNTVMEALASTDGSLSSLVMNMDTVFRTTASRNRQLAETFAVLPTFLDESEQTADRLRTFAGVANPTIDALHPVAEEATPTLKRLNDFAPDLEALMKSLGPLFEAGRNGLPDTSAVLELAAPLLKQTYPFLLSLDPVIQWLGQYNQEFASMLANTAAATAGSDGRLSPNRGDVEARVLRGLVVQNAENLAPAVTQRLPTNRTNPYSKDDGLDLLGSPGLNSYETRQCARAQVLPTLDPGTPPAQAALINTWILGMGAVAPGCIFQGDFTFQGRTGQYPHVSAEAEK